MELIGLGNLVNYLTMHNHFVGGAHHHNTMTGLYIMLIKTEQGMGSVVNQQLRSVNNLKTFSPRCLGA